jgi:hypothetical protein
MSERGRIHVTKKGQVMGGHAVGILLLEVGYPILPGNVANATTFDFPVRYKVVREATIPRLLHGADSAVLEIVKAAGKELEEDGVKALVGSCGYFGQYQQEMAAELDIPVFMSSLLQVPMICRSLKPGQKLGILCADATALNPKVLESCGVTPDLPYVSAGLEGGEEFRSGILEGKGTLDNDKVTEEVVGAATRLVEENPEIGAILLECTDMPPYAKAVQDALNLPVWDFNSMINWIYYGVVRHEYKGFI